MADTSKYTIEERLTVRIWVHEEERTGETCKEIRENFFPRLNKAAPREANLQGARISQRATAGCGPT